MCGIVGAISTRNIVPVLLEGLRKLEYRGYDSAGIAVINGGLHRLRSVGRVAELANMAERAGTNGVLGSPIPAGPPTAPPPRKTPIPTSPAKAWRWSTTASSRTTRPCASG